MRILVLTPNFPNMKNLNSGIFIYQQIKSLAELGIECHVLIPYNWFPPLGLHLIHPYWREGKEQLEQIIINDSSIIIHPVPVFRKLPNRIFDTGFLDDCYDSFLKYIKKTFTNLDWIYGHFLTDFGFLASRLGKKLHVKTATIARGDDIHSWPQKFPDLKENLEFCLQNSDLVLANSKSLLDDVKKIAPHCFDDNKLFTVYNGINLDIFVPYNDSQKYQAKKMFNLPEDGLYVLCIGRSVRSKGWLKLLDLMKRNQLKFPFVKLICLAIKSSDFESIDIQHEIIQRNLNKSVVVLSEVEHKNLPSLYNSVNGFCLLSDNEGFANVVLEASACNLPLLLTDAGGNSELFSSSKSTVFIENSDDSTLIDLAFGRFVDNLSKNNHDTREKVLSIGSYKDNAKKLIQLFHNWGEK